VVRAIWSLEGNTGEADFQPIVSDGCVELVFNVGDTFVQRTIDGVEVRQPRAMVVGPTERPTLVKSGRHVDVIGVRLQPWATAAVLGADASALRDRVVSLGDVSRPMRRVASEALGSFHEDRSRPRLLSLISGALAPRRLPDTFTPPMVESIRDGLETPSIRALAARFGVSVRSVQRAFARDVGIGPRAMLRLSRVQRALGLAQMHPPRRWTQIAAEAGYFDQPHFIREFRELVGLLPSEFRADPPELTHSFVTAQP
jgi:AraC-like DNA-binding protein